MQLGVRQSRVGKSVSCAMETRMKLLIFASFVTIPPNERPSPRPHLHIYPFVVACQMAEPAPWAREWFWKGWDGKDDSDGMKESWTRDGNPIME